VVEQQLAQLEMVLLLVQLANLEWVGQQALQVSHTLKPYPSPLQIHRLAFQAEKTYYC